MESFVGFRSEINGRVLAYGALIGFNRCRQGNRSLQTGGFGWKKLARFLKRAAPWSSGSPLPPYVALRMRTKLLLSWRACV